MKILKLGCFVVLTASLFHVSSFAQTNDVDVTAADAPTFNIDKAGSNTVSIFFEQRGLYRSGTILGENLVVAPRHAARRPNDDETVTITRNDGTLYGRLNGSNSEIDTVFINAPGAAPSQGLMMAKSSPQQGEAVNIVIRSSNQNVRVVRATLQANQAGVLSLQTSSPLSKAFAGAPVFDDCGFYVATIFNPERESAARRDGSLGRSVKAVSARRLSTDRTIGMSLASIECPTQSERVAAQKEKLARQKAADAAILAAQDAAKKQEEEEKQKKEAEEKAKKLADAEKKAKQEEAARKKARAAEMRANEKLSEAEKKALEAKEAQEAEALAREEAEALAKEAEEKLKVQAEEKEKALAAASEDKKKQLMKVGGISLGVLLALLLLTWVLVSRQRKARNLAEDDASRQRDYARGLEAKVPPKAYSDCLLYGTSTIKLPGQQLPEATGGITVGRHPANSQVVFDREDVSRAHARFFSRNNEVHLEDLNSTNGTFINGRRLSDGERHIVQAGDMVRLGDHEFEFRKLT